MKFLIIDNYDSFVYNIAQYLGELGVDCDVVRNDKITVKEIEQTGGYDAVVISPGPGTPIDKKYFGVCSDIIRDIGHDMPILGICLGHQGIIDAFGGTVTNAGTVRHGKTSPITYTDSELFQDVENPFQATRYHSLVGDKTVIPDVLQVIATADDDNEIMAVRHRKHLIQGVQFHPESIMTKEGKKILRNFIRQVKTQKAIRR